MVIDLPFGCEENFVDDFGAKCEEIVLYEHHNKQYKDKDQYHYVLTLELRGLRKARKIKSKHVATVVSGAVTGINTPKTNPFTP